MLGAIWFTAGLLLVVSGWHWIAVETEVRSRTPQTSEPHRRTAIGYGIWNPDIPDRVRGRAVVGSIALSTSLLLASIGALLSGHPDLSALVALGTAVSLFDVLSKRWQYCIQHRPDTH
jgi:hypothetical protein